MCALALNGVHLSKTRRTIDCALKSIRAPSLRRHATVSLPDHSISRGLEITHTQHTITTLHAATSLASCSAVSSGVFEAHESKHNPRHERMNTQRVACSKEGLTNRQASASLDARKGRTSLSLLSVDHCVHAASTTCRRQPPQHRSASVLPRGVGSVGKALATTLRGERLECTRGAGGASLARAVDE